MSTELVEIIKERQVKTWDENIWNLAEDTEMMTRVNLTTGVHVPHAPQRSVHICAHK